MSLRVRQVLVFALVLAAAVYSAWLGFRPQTMGDYPGWYGSAMDALVAGHLGGFVHLLPMTAGGGGSLMLRAPAALAGKLLGGGELAMFRAGALLCLLAAGGLGLWLARDMRRAGRSPIARGAVIGLCVLTPSIFDAILFGHPEEPLGAALAVASVLLAAEERPTLAGLALGVAIVNKPWSVLAVAPAILAAPYGRVRIAAIAGTVTGAWLGLALLAGPAQLSRTVAGATGPVVAHPPDFWWPFAQLHAPHGVTPAYLAPRWISDHALQLAVLLAIPLSILLARRGRPSVESCLALLALLFLIRCLLDPSNHVYYHVPFIYALTAWQARSARVPVLALLATALLWLVFHTVAGVADLDLQYLAFLGVTIPFVVILSVACFGRPRLPRLRTGGRTAVAGA